MDGGILGALAIGVAIGVVSGFVAGRRYERSAYAWGHARRWAGEGWYYAGRSLGAVVLAVALVVGSGLLWLLHH